MKAVISRSAVSLCAFASISCAAFDLESKIKLALQPTLSGEAFSNLTFSNSGNQRNLSDYVSGGTAPYEFSTTIVGSIPAYLNLSVNAGVLSVGRQTSVAPPATLSAVGTLPRIRVTVADSKGNSSTSEFALSLQFKRIFVASDYVNSDKTTWSGSATYSYSSCQSANPVEIANCRCRTAAAGGGLSNAQKFRVWLSTSSVDAKCNLAGTLSSGCVVSQFSGGPWYNTTGQLIAYDAGATASQGLYNTTGIINAIQFNEKGNVATTQVWAGTNNDGTYQANFTCADWTSTAGGNAFSMGTSNLTAGTAGLAPYWHGTSNAGCDTTVRGFYCMEGE